MNPENENVIKDIVTITNDKFKVDKKRCIRFYDTEDHMLYKKHDYVFRERFGGDDREVTLKFHGYASRVTTGRSASRCVTPTATSSSRGC